MRIHPLDLAIVVAYLLGVTALGMRFRRGQQNATDYFLGGRTAPWWALAFSIVATETSTLTIIGTPAIAYGGNLTFLQLVFGYLIGRVLIVLLLLPGYCRGQHFPDHPRHRRRRARFSHRAGCERRAGNIREAGGGHCHRAHGAVHVRRRDEGGDLDGRGAVAALSDWKRCNVFRAAPPHSRRLERSGTSSGRGGAQAATFRFFLESCHQIYLLVRTNRRRVPHDGQPRHGPNHRPTITGGEKGTGQPVGAARERRH